MPGKWTRSVEGCIHTQSVGTINYAQTDMAVIL